MARHGGRLGGPSVACPGAPRIPGRRAGSVPAGPSRAHVPGPGRGTPELQFGKTQLQQAGSSRMVRANKYAAHRARRIQMKMRSVWHARSLSGLAVAGALLVGSGVASWAIVTDESLVSSLHDGALEHTDEG